MDLEDEARLWKTSKPVPRHIGTEFIHPGFLIV